MVLDLKIRLPSSEEEGSFTVTSVWKRFRDLVLTEHTELPLVEAPRTAFSTVCVCGGGY